MLYNQSMQNNQKRRRIIAFSFLVVGIVILIYGVFLVVHPNILIEWTTATEFDTAGFNLYRKELPEGENQKINPTLIPAAGESLQGSTYQFKDARIVPGKLYQYQLEDLDLNGQTTLHDPIQVKAKRDGVPEVVLGLGLITLAGIIILSQKKTLR